MHACSHKLNLCQKHLMPMLMIKCRLALRRSAREWGISRLLKLHAHVQDMLDAGQEQEPAQVAAVEEDLLMLFEAWHRLCDPHMPFHIRNKDADVPTIRMEEYPHEFAVPSCPAGPQASPSDSSTSAEDIVAPEHLWLANLLNCFGHKTGFKLVCQVG